MSQRIKTVFIVLFCVLCLAGCGDAGEKSSVATGLMKGQMAPDFVLKDLADKQVSLSSFKNNNAVCLIFWATWCPYCVMEVPKMKQYHEKYSGKGLKIIAVNVGANDPVQRVIGFQKKYEVPYTILYDAESTVSRLYGVQGIPVSILIDRKGIIQYRGYQLPENAEQLFAQIL